MRAVYLSALVLSLAGCGKAPPAPPAVQPAKPDPVTREEFKKAVEGKTPDEVVEAVGKPDQTSESGGRKYWYYDRRTTDPTTGKTDARAQVVFGEDGRVRSVNFS